MAVVRIDYDSAGVKAIHYANGDTDYRDGNAFVEELEAQIGIGDIQATVDYEPWRDRILRERPGVFAEYRRLMYGDPPCVVWQRGRSSCCPIQEWPSAPGPHHRR